MFLSINKKRFMHIICKHFFFICGFIGFEDYYIYLLDCKINNLNTYNYPLQKTSSTAKKMALSLSREEQEELTRSKKKVKDVKHAGFSERSVSGPSSPVKGLGPWNQSLSF